MIKYDKQYTNFQGETKAVTLWFHLRKSMILDHPDLRDDLERVSKIVSGEERELVDAETFEIIRVVRRFIDLSYGIQDGELFRQGEKICEDFRSHPVYDEFLFDLFNPPSNVLDFLVGVFPPDLLAEAQKRVNQDTLPLESAAAPEEPAYKRENRRPSTEEIRDMSHSELQAAFAWVEQNRL